MAPFKRYGVYVVPDGALFRRGSDWLGWDAVAGQPCAHPDLPGLPAPAADLTSTPRKYGFHGTVKPPMRLAQGMSGPELEAALRRLAADAQHVDGCQLTVSALGGFVALVLQTPSEALSALAARVVEELDAFRAPPTEAELERRRKSGLSPAEEARLVKWGYPYVMEGFRFHLTLTGRLQPEAAETARAVLARYFAADLKTPLGISSLALVGEAEDGFFRVITRVPLGAGYD